MKYGIEHAASLLAAALAVFFITQFSDFGLNPQFFDIMRAPVAINVQSVGNKAAENVQLRLTTNSKIENLKHTFDKCDSTENSIVAVCEKLNPGANAYLFVFVAGKPHLNQISGLNITHTEGKAVNRKTRDVPAGWNQPTKGMILGFLALLVLYILVLYFLVPDPFEPWRRFEQP